MDLEQIVSYGELRDALPGTGKGRVPRLNQLKKMARVVLHRKTASGVIEIYSNGFFTFEECGRVTVYGVDRCERPETYTCNGKKEAGMEKLDLGEYPWEVILESAGSARLDINAENRHMYQKDLSTDVPEAENNIAFSVPPEHERRETEEAEANRKEEMLGAMREALKKLDPRQAEILQLRYGEGLTYVESGNRMGITKGTAHVNCERAMKSVRKELGIIQKKTQQEKISESEKNRQTFTPKNHK